MVAHSSDFHMAYVKLNMTCLIEVLNKATGSIVLETNHLWYETVSTKRNKG